MKEFLVGWLQFNLEVAAVVGEVLVDTFSQGEINTKDKDEYYIGKNYTDNMTLIETLKEINR